jgi:hypothetical protein
MPNRDLDDILASLRSAPDGVACFKSILKKHGGLWFDPVDPRDLFEVHLLGLTGSGPTATIAVVDWMTKAERLRNV